MSTNLELAYDSIKAELVASHQAHNAPWPQYADWCDGAVLVRITKRASYKSGAKLVPGMHMLARHSAADTALPAGYTCWHPGTGWHVFVPATKAVQVAA